MLLYWRWEIGWMRLLILSAAAPALSDSWDRRAADERLRSEW